MDPTIAIDGIWGPHTARVYAESLARTVVAAQGGSANRIRLVMHTSALKRSDFYTFEREAMRLASDYQQHFPHDQVRRILVRSGREIVQAINACTAGSILSWDVVSHTNFGGIHISNDLAAPRRADPQRQRRHLQHRSCGPNPQSAKDAMFMEEELRGLYTTPDVARTVADYFNQDIAHGAAYLRELRFDRFASECYVELHGCRTADRSTPLDRHFDAFIVKLSDEIPCDGTVVGHTGQSSPRGEDGYRHGKVSVFRHGREVFAGRRETLKFPNASTPGEGSQSTRTCEPTPRDDWRPPPESPPPVRRVPSWVTRTTPVTGRDEPPPPRRHDEPPRRDDTPPPSSPPKLEVPWGAIIGGATAIGTLIHNAQRDRRQNDQGRTKSPREHHDRPGHARSGGLPYGGFGRFGRGR